MLFVMSLPILVAVIMFNKKYRKEFFYKIFERFAFYGNLIKQHDKPTIWIHCASLGEVRAVEPILDNLKADNNIILTTITKTGREYAQKIKKTNFVFLFPVDIYPIMLKAFRMIKPDMIIIVETELWPTLLYTAFKKNVLVVTVNGRMSEKAFNIYKKLSFFWKVFVNLISIIIARSSDDSDRFKILRENNNDVFTSGNIKYDRDFSTDFKRSSISLKEEDFIFTAGSIRDGEEEIIIDAFSKIRSEFDNVKFFIAPRHITKINDIINFIKNKNIEYSLFSSNNFKSNFILVDVFGKLQEIYSISDVCYVGGSMVDMGGQNPVEPAGLAKPVLFGKYMDNFASESKILVKNGGALIVQDSIDLASKIKELILDHKMLKSMGQNALETVEAQKGAVAFTINMIKSKLYVK
jgi:3-deoxy-D-manno-octulosonic-acid transferase